jgi:hypothetical protein
MSRVTLRGLGPPFPKQQEILDYLWEPSPHIKQAVLQCGLGFGKTTLCIDIAVRLLCMPFRTDTLFLEPDAKRLGMIFWSEWEKIVPKKYYTIKTIKRTNQKYIEWNQPNKDGDKNCLYPDIRNITGNRQDVADGYRGIEFTNVLDDECAIKFNFAQYKNTFNRIRGDSPMRFYLNVTTPKPGPYRQLKMLEYVKVFYGYTQDNVYLMARHPTYIEDMMRNMSRDEARRELFGEDIALEGRVFKDALVDRKNIEHQWPDGNVHWEHNTFREGKPWWLFADLGSATGAYVVVQREPAPPGWGGHIWIAVADYCPQTDASAARALDRLDMEFGPPAGVVAGLDINTKSAADGSTVANIVDQIWGFVPVHSVSEVRMNKQLQFNRMEFLICTGSHNRRRFCVARDFVSLDKDSRRGVIECLIEYEHRPVDQRRASEFLPKGSDQPLCHVADALMMGAIQIMAPPRWLKTKERVRCDERKNQ